MSEITKPKNAIKYSIPPRLKPESNAIIPPNKVMLVLKSIILKPEALFLKPHAIKPTNKLNITIVVIVHL